jgi:hypothetical protein
MDLSYANSVPNILKIGRYMRGDNTMYSLYVVSVLANLLPEILEEGIAYTNNTGVTITNGTIEIENGITFAGDGFQWDFKDQSQQITSNLLPMVLTTGLLYKNVTSNTITNGTDTIANNSYVMGDNKTWDLVAVNINLSDLPLSSTNNVYYKNNTGIVITDGITSIAINEKFFGSGNTYYNETPYSITRSNVPYITIQGMNYKNDTGQSITDGINTISNGTTFIAVNSNAFSIVPIPISLSALPYTTTNNLTYNNATGYSITNGTSNVINGNDFIGDGMDWDTVITSITSVPVSTTNGIRYQNNTGSNITDGSEVIADGVIFRGNGNVFN